jgi:hypothetical protein
MSSVIQNLLEKSLGDGARSTKFDVDIVFANPSLASQSELASVVKTTQFPSKTHQKIDLMYKGRAIPVKGQTKYNQTWTCTFYLSEDHRLKNAFEVWIEAIDQQHNYIKGRNVAPTQAAHAAGGYTSNVRLYQRDFNDIANTAEYVLYNVFPVEVSELEYSADSRGQIQEFTVTFAYSHYELRTVAAPAGNFVDEAVGRVQEEVQDRVQGLINTIGSNILTAIGVNEQKFRSATSMVSNIFNF